MELAATATVSPSQEKLTKIRESSKAHQPAMLCATMGRPKNKVEIKKLNRKTLTYARICV